MSNTSEKRREYQREYYRKNREKILEYRKKWTNENKSKVVANNARYYEKKMQQLAEQSN